VAMMPFMFPGFGLMIPGGTGPIVPYKMTQSESEDLIRSMRAAIRKQIRPYTNRDLIDDELYVVCIENKRKADEHLVELVWCPLGRGNPKNLLWRYYVIPNHSSLPFGMVSYSWKVVEREREPTQEDVVNLVNYCLAGIQASAPPPAPVTAPKSPETLWGNYLKNCVKTVDKLPCYICCKDLSQKQAYITPSSFRVCDSCLIYHISPLIVGE